MTQEIVDAKLSSIRYHSKRYGIKLLATCQRLRHVSAC